VNLNLPEKRYYSIGEVANAFQVKTSLLRFWDNTFKEIQVVKNKAGNRKFTKENIEVITRIYYLLKEKGLTIEGAKKHLKQENKKLDNATIIERLQKIKTTLEQLKKNM